MAVALTVVALSLACHSRVPDRSASGDGLGELLRSMVTDSLVGGGRRPDQRYVPANAVSDSLLRATGLPLTPRSERLTLACPGSTDAADSPVAGEVGYVVRIDRTEQAPGVLRLEVTVTCEFAFRGRRQAFAQAGTWELLRDGSRWRVNRTIDRRIT